METSRIRELFQKDGFLKVLSVFIAIILWAYVSFVLNPEVQKEFTNVPVKFNEQALLNSGLALVNNNYTVSFEVKGRRNVVASIDKERLAAVADISGDVKSGRNRVSVKITGLPSVEIIREPEDIFVEIDKAYSVKKNISVVTKGEPQKGFSVVNPTVNPAVANIEGAQGLINSIHDVRVQVDVTNLDKSFDARERVLIVDSKGNEIKGLKSSVEVADISVPIMKVRLVPIKVDLRGGASNDVVEKVSVNPDKAALLLNERANSINEIRTEPIDVIGVTRDITKKVRLLVPEDITLAGNEGFVNVTIHAAKVANKTITIQASSVQIRDKKANTDYKVALDKVDISVKGPEEIINNLSSNLITAAVSVKGVPDGQHPVALAITLPEGVKLQNSGKIFIPVVVMTK